MRLLLPSPLARRPAFMSAAAAAFMLAGHPLHAQVSEYDSASNVLTIPSVSVGAATYTQVKLRNVGNYVFELQAATDQVPPGPGVANFDAASGIVTMPAVKVGAVTYIDVTLRHRGNYVFELVGATELPAATLAAVNALIEQSRQQFATATPASGSARYAYFDSCYRSNGVTRQWLVDDYDANLALRRARDAFVVGFTPGTAQVTAVRQRSNADGSTRQEIDVEYDQHYADGTYMRQATTMISGSSAGTPGCTTPQVATAMRYYGNQQLVGTAVRARNMRFERYALANGAALSPAIQYARRINWSVTDPMGNATYVVVTGPGPNGNVNGSDVPFSLKFLSPRLLREAPELQGKPGNFLNWREDDSFRYCRVSDSGLPVVGRADCAGLGATSNEWGWTTSLPNAAADSGFAAQGWVSGGVYRFDVYNDDGWKTVNGHSTRTPIATYYDTLEVLPYAFVDMAGSGTSSDRFPRLSFGGSTPTLVASNATSATPAPMSVSWTAPVLPQGSRPIALWGGWEFHQGPRAGNPSGGFNPAYRTINFSFPGSLALTAAGWPVTPKVSGQASKTYTEFALQYVDREDLQVVSIALFQ